MVIDYLCGVYCRFQHYFSYDAAVSVPVQAFPEFFLPVLHTIFFLSYPLLSTVTIFETVDSSERGMGVLVIETPGKYG